MGGLESYRQRGGTPHRHCQQQREQRLSPPPCHGCEDLRVALFDVLELMCADRFR